MKSTTLSALVLLVGLIAAPGCEHRPPVAPGTARAQLMQARSGLRTQLVARDGNNERPPDPPPDRLRLIQYDAPPGKLSAYMSIPPRDGKRHPAIVWIAGGDCNSIGDVWSRAARANDQTASAFREAGIVTMYPSLRGGNGGPGQREGWLGEVDDVLAAAEYLAKQDGVDGEHIYLGGHSTGGTLVLLTAECSDRFRAVFSFGPVEDVGTYGDEYLPFKASDPHELEARSPIHWLSAIQTPTFVFEGTKPSASNIASLRAMERAQHGDSVHFHPVDGVDHFGVLYPINRLVVGKILLDAGEGQAIVFTKEELDAAVKR